MSEFANGLWKNFRKELLDRVQAEASLRSIRRTIAHWHATEPMLDRALELSLRLDHPIYDFIYAALAERNGLQCVTADRRFMRTIEKTEYAKWVVDLAEWRP